MSHFTKLDRAQIVDAEAFIKACADLGLTDVHRDVQIKDFYGKTMKADVAVKTGRYDLALVKNESGKYDMVADWWGVRGERSQQMKDAKIISDNDLQDYLLRHSTKHTIISRYRRQGFRAEIREDENQNMTVKLTRAD